MEITITRRKSSARRRNGRFSRTPILLSLTVRCSLWYSKRVQLLDIYYSGVGILHELTPEEMEEAFQHHLIERSKEKNGVTAKATPFQRNNLIDIQEPPWGTFLTEGVQKVAFFFNYYMYDLVPQTGFELHSQILRKLHEFAICIHFRI